MPDITNYAETIKVILGEAGKYLALLLFAVLALRLWRSARYVSKDNKTKAVLTACATSAVAVLIGYVSFRHSMGLMYSAYGMRSFESGNIPAAYGLFRRSSEFWQSADVTGREGVCLLLMNQTTVGKQLLDEAKTERHGRRTPFEDFFLGLHYFLSNQPDEAIPLLESSVHDYAYRWRVTKLLAVIVLEKGDVSTAARLMQPFANTEPRDSDHAYIMASLKLAEGKTNDARAILEPFGKQNAAPLWQARIERLRQKLNPN